MRAALLLPVLLLAAAPEGGTPIEVEVTSVDSSRGTVSVEICPEASFLKEDCPYSGEAPAVRGTTLVRVANVPPGRYAAQGYHDSNGNRRLDRTLFGLPKEEVGFSNDAPVHLRPPRFADAGFVHGAVPQRITFALRHLP